MKCNREKDDSGKLHFKLLRRKVLLVSTQQAVIAGFPVQNPEVSQSRLPTLFKANANCMQLYQIQGSYIYRKRNGDISF